MKTKGRNFLDCEMMQAAAADLMQVHTLQPLPAEVEGEERGGHGGREEPERSGGWLGGRGDRWMRR